MQEVLVDSIYSSVLLPAFVTVTCTCSCSVDVDSKATPFKEAT